MVEITYPETVESFTMKEKMREAVTESGDSKSTKNNTLTSKQRALFQEMKNFVESHKRMIYNRDSLISKSDASKKK